MKNIIILLLLVTTVHGQNRYDGINERNAFSLVGDILPPVESILLPEQPSAKLFLTGIMRYQGLTNVFLYSKDLPKRFITLNHKKPVDSGIELLKVEKSKVSVMNNGIMENLSFETHRIPTVVGPTPISNRPTVIKKDSKDDKNKNKDKKASPPPVKAQVVTVPSRRPRVDPRIIEKGLEYLSRMEEGEKRDYLLKRMESLQSGQRQLKTDIDQNERRRQYDEYRRRRER